jgi:hypothetical protein
VRCMCGGPYPSIEVQARALHDESGMPEWSMKTYVQWVEAINMALMMIYIEHIRRNLPSARACTHKTPSHVRFRANRTLNQHRGTAEFDPTRT